MKTFVTVLFVSLSALAQNVASNSIAAQKQQTSDQKPNLVEVVCRMKAKEAAAHAFRSCMLDDKAAQMQELKKSVAEKIQKRNAQKQKTEKPAPLVEKNEVFKDKETTVQVQATPKMDRLKPAMLIEDDEQIPEPTVLAEDPE